MKFFILFSLILSSSAFAIDFNKVTGTFDVQDKSESVSEVNIAAANFGTFNPNQDKSRAPASVEESTEKVTEGINEVTGTFR